MTLGATLGATALRPTAEQYPGHRLRGGSLVPSRVEVTDRDDMPLGLHDPRAEARRAEAVLDPSAVGVVHEAAMPTM